MNAPPREPAVFTKPILLAPLLTLSFAVAAHAQADRNSGIDAMLDYVLPRALSTPGPSGQLSAILSNPSALDGERAPCLALEPVVMIDLDPKGALARLDACDNADPDVANAISYLRVNGVRIAWISDLPSSEEDRLRRVLASSGLDPQGQDIVLLQTNSTERKQQRRVSFARKHCVLAIGGDAHSDFDELFDYLKNPSDAAALEPIIGAGWFLLPQPLATSA